jgi:hypothetical protein
MKTLIFVLILAISSNPQSYKKVKIFIDDLKDVETLHSLGLEFDHPHYTKDNAIEVFVNESEFQILQSSPFRYEILIADWKAYYNNLPKLSNEEIQRFKQESLEMFGVEGFHLGTMGGYMTLAEAYAELDTLKNKFPSLISTKQAIGYSNEDRPVYMVKISDNPNVDENEPEILYTALHHAREPMGMMQMFYFMYYLLENYTTNPSVQYLVNNREMYFITVINPDGYEHNRSTNPSGGGMWRKNRRLNTGGSYGVDLNRNYGPYNYWNAPNGGSSTSPSSDTYRGTAPFSEPETAAIRDFLASRKIKNALNYHTYSNLLIYPYGALSRETPDSLIFREYAADMTRYNGYTTGTDMQTVGYSTRGNSDDYFYDGDTLLSGGKIFAMTPEVGSSSDGFWPPQSRIFPLAQENVHPNLYYAWVAGEYVSLDNPNFAQSYFNPGNIVQLFPRLKNKGLSTGHNLQLMMTSLSSYATINSGATNIDSIKSRMTSTSINPLSFTISPTTPVETKIKLLFTTSASGAVMSQDTVSIIVGYPEFIFIDTTGNPLIYWTVTEPLSRPFWEATTASYYSSPNSYTDSKSGNYINSDTVTMTMTNSINLSTYTNPKLSFWTKYDIENNWDYGQVEISTNNGSTWTPLAGNYTNLGTGSFQPNGQPLYDGTQTNWVREEISLAGYTSSQVKLRFKLLTDGSVQKDGWYVDDISIVFFTSSNIQLTALIEGFYNGTTMTSDTVLLQLRNSIAPYALAEQKQIYLNSSGQGNGLFKNMSETSSYYLVVKHRNSIETWSAAPQSFTSGVLSYDFTTAQNKAYGNNLVEKGTKWCIYSGDVDQDGLVDLTDEGLVINDSNLFTIGIGLITDLNSDLWVDLSDVIIVVNNTNKFISKLIPINN